MMASTNNDEITVIPESPPCIPSPAYALTQRMKDFLNRADSDSQDLTQELKELAQQLSVALESPSETVERLVYYVRNLFPRLFSFAGDGWKSADLIPTTQPLQASVVRVAMNLNLFSILRSNGLMTGQQLAEMTGADHVLLVRILRHLAAMHVIMKVGNDTYSKNDITERLATPAVTAFFKFNFDAKGAACMALPEYLKKCKYQNTYDPNDCAFQHGNRSEYNCWEWSDHHRAAVDEFNQAVIPYVEQASWMNSYPLMARLKAGHNLIENEVVLVNISGGRGHECEAIRARYPVLPGRMVLQDNADNIAHALPVRGMDVMIHDIFSPQPIKGS